MKKKNIVIICVLTALLGAVCFFANAFFGNPISKILVSNKAQKYVDKHYPTLNLQINKPFYNFKDGRYYVLLKSETSIDTHFSISFSQGGKLMQDDYSSVTGGFNTYGRLDEEYRKITDPVIDRFCVGEKSFGFCSLNFSGGLENLVLDKIYDVNQLGKEYGKIVLNIQEPDLTQQVLTANLQQIKAAFDEEGLNFSLIDLTLRANIGEKTEYLQVKDFKYSDIASDNLPQLVEENIKATREYYDALDAEKKSQMENLAV